MARMIEAGGNVDAIVTDPPYHLTSIVKRFGQSDSAPAKVGATGAYKRHSTGFMGKKWDGGDIAFQPETWRLCFDLLKPGAHMMVMGGTRTYHRMACAVEDAGFEIRDTIMWLYGSGFPKSHDVSKGIDKAAGTLGSFGAPKSDAHAGWIKRGKMRGIDGHDGYQRPWMNNQNAVDRNARQYLPATNAAKQWQGWGTALKPACEPIVLARKPLSEKSIAANVLRHGTGGVNVDECRIALAGDYKSKSNGRPSLTGLADNYDPNSANEPDTVGRWPANVIHDGSDEVAEAFGGAGEFTSAARFFYSAKADKADRLGSKHPTVKPVDLIAYLCRLITPIGGTVLDPFAGSGTTGMACLREGFECVLIEREAEYVVDIKTRFDHVRGADTPLFAGPST